MPWHQLAFGLLMQSHACSDQQCIEDLVAPHQAITQTTICRILAAVLSKVSVSVHTFRVCVTLTYCVCMPYRTRGTNIEAFAVHPGMINTNLTRHSPLMKAAVWLGYFIMQSAEQARAAHAVLSHAMLCYAALCYAVLRCVVLCCVVLCCPMLCCVSFIVRQICICKTWHQTLHGKQVLANSIMMAPCD